MKVISERGRRREKERVVNGLLLPLLSFPSCPLIPTAERIKEQIWLLLSVLFPIDLLSSVCCLSRKRRSEAISPSSHRGQTEEMGRGNKDGGMLKVWGQGKRKCVHEMWKWLEENQWHEEAVKGIKRRKQSDDTARGSDLKQDIFTLRRGTLGIIELPAWGNMEWTVKHKEQKDL